MAKQIPITETELPIMKALWARGPATSPELFEGMDRNKSTLKTMLKRLVERGAVKADGINRRNYIYSAILTEGDYMAQQRKSLLDRVFEGSAEKMLLNFVSEERISAETLRRLATLVENGENENQNENQKEKEK